MNPSSSKRLLMLTHRFPFPPNRGDRIRSYNLLKVLSQHYQISLGCTADEQVASEHLEHLKSLCEQLYSVDLARIRRLGSAFKSVAIGKSLTEGMFASRLLAQQVLRWQTQRPFDAVLVFCSSMFPYVDHRAFADTPMIVDLVDVDSAKWQQMSRESTRIRQPGYRLEAARVKKLEQRIANRAAAVALVSDSEADLFRQVVSVTKPAIGISNGVDTDYFHPQANVHSDATPPRSYARQSVDTGNSPSPIRSYARQSVDNGNHSLPLESSNFLRLVFTGVLDYSPNVEGMVWFCRTVLPQLQRTVNVQISIVGRRPCRQVLELDTLDGVTVVGEVPDVRPYLHAADIAVSPLKLARGIQNKVLEAMASGLPVVLTRQSAEGIDAKSGQQFWIADSVDEWCRAVSELAADASRRMAIGNAARKLVMSEYSWPARMAQFVSIIDAQISTAGSNSSPHQLAGVR